jgi:hypothetical protein
MKISLLRGTAAAGLVTVLLVGCAVGVEGGYGGDVGYGVDYYEPYGGLYGGWGTGFLVAPFRGGGERREDRGGGGRDHAFRSAPASHPVPSIPSRGRSGGGSRRH